MNTRLSLSLPVESTLPQPALRITRDKPPLIITVIGKPGSGKSTFIEFMTAEFRSQAFRVFNDRDVLLQLAQTNSSPDLIRPLDSLNFEILDERAYDVAIDKLLSAVIGAGVNEISLVEFSRNNYVRTFQRSAALLAHNQSLIVYVETPFNICQERNIQRAVLNNSYSVPSAEMESYFKVDDINQLVRKHPKRVIVVNNKFEKAGLIRGVDEVWSSLQNTVCNGGVYGKLENNCRTAL